MCRFFEVYCLQLNIESGLVHIGIEENTNKSSNVFGPKALSLAISSSGHIAKYIALCKPIGICICIVCTFVIVPYF